MDSSHQPAATFRISALVRDQTPPDQVERTLAGLVVLPDNKQLLARRRVVARRNVAHPAIVDIETINDREAKR